MAPRALFVFFATSLIWGQAQQDENVLFDDLKVVESAGMHPQSIRDAPSNVTIITARDIRVYGYRTLGEALASARGFYLSYDGAYQHLGLRGFNMPGDFGTRWQVMLNGHNLSDHIYDASNYFGQDFGLDLALVKRIEVVRGPSSALYGSNALFGIINVVTKPPSEFSTVRLITEGGSSERKGEVDAAVSSAHGEFLLSGSVFNNLGKALDVPQYGATMAAAADAERGYHSFFDFRQGEWQVMALASSRQKGMPVPWDDAVVGDAGNRTWDQRRFAEGIWSHPLRGGQLTWRNSWDWYSYRGLEDYPTDGGGPVRNADLARNAWLTSRLLYQFAESRAGRFFAGAEVSGDLYSWQRNYDFGSPRVWYLNDDHSQVRTGFLAQDEITLNPNWKAVAGVRVDHVTGYGSSVSPRFALLYQPSERTFWKLIGGQSYRNPSIYEQYYAFGSEVLIANPLRPERGFALEAKFERQLNRRWSLIVGGYHYRIRDLIGFVPFKGGYQYQNRDRVTSSGLEWELDRRGRLLDMAATLTVQRTRDASGSSIPNSPAAVGSLRLSRSWGQDRLILGGELCALSSRATLGGAHVAPAWQPNLTIGSARFVRGLEFQAGIRNLLDRPRADPIALDPRVDVLAGRGREWFVRLIWHSDD